MDVRLIRRLGTILLTLVVLSTALATPVYAGEEAKLEGTIEKIIKGDDLPEMAREMGVKKILDVDGVHVLITKDTMKEGKLTLGADVEVEGTVKAVHADDIEVRDTESRLNVNGTDVDLRGTIEKIISGDMLPEMAKAHGVTKILKVDGIKVLIDGDTDIDGLLQVGATVRVGGEAHAVLAERITVEVD